MKRHSLSYAALGIIAIALIGVLWVAFSAASHRAGVVRIGVNHSPPYAVIGPDGKSGGFSVQLLNEAARRSGLTLEWVVVPEGPDVALRNGKVDVWHLLTDIPERHRWAYFSDPYLRVSFILVVPEQGTIHSVEDAIGHRLSHDTFPLDAGLARKLVPHSTYFPRPRGHELELLCRGEVDATFISLRSALTQLMHRSPECNSFAFEFLPVEGAQFQMAIGATSKGIGAAQTLRAEITNMAQDHSLDHLYRKYLQDSTVDIQVVNELTRTRQNSRLLRYCAGILAIVVVLLAVLIIRERTVRLAIKTAYDFASAVLDQAGGLVFISDRHGRIVRFNRACERATGKTLHQVRHKTSWDNFVPPEERSEVQAMFAQMAGGVAHASHEHHWITKDGPRLFSWSNTILLDKAGHVDYIIATGIDISNREAAEQRLGYEATHDVLTNLRNRRHFLRELDAAFSAAKSGGSPFTLVLADLDHFKIINDSHGHEAGDEVLVYLARVLRYELALCDLAARLGGDEFCLLIRSVGVTSILERIRTHLMDHEFRSPAGKTFHAAVTFGTAAWSDSTPDSVALLREADQSLYLAKDRSPGRLTRFEAQMAALEEELRTSSDANPAVPGAVPPGRDDFSLPRLLPPPGRAPE